jgi:hypothetical protein
MAFSDDLKPWTAEKIIEVIRCKRRTAYAWKAGDKVAPDWVQGLVLYRMRHVKPDAEESRKSSE